MTDALSRIPPLWLLALLSLSSTIAMHIFVPALPFAAADLGTSTGAIQLTIGVYIMGLAVGQLVYGPISDRFGRRRIMMLGLGLFTVASFAAWFSPNLHVLLAARLVQALGGAVGLVLARAMVRDTAKPGDAARRLALMNLMVMAGPGLSPILGGFLAGGLGWRSIFLALSLFGLATLILSWRLLPETISTAPSSGREVMRHYLHLAKSPAFLGFAIGGGCATTSMYAFIASAPFILVQELHRPSYEVGTYLAILVCGIWAGSAGASRLLSRVAMGRLMVGANTISLAASFLLLGAVLTHNLSATLAIATMFVFAFGAGMASPPALTQAISVNPLIIGSASGLYGFTQMLVGAACTSLGALGHDPALASALVLAGACIVSQVAFWVALRQRESVRLQEATAD